MGLIAASAGGGNIRLPMVVQDERRRCRRCIGTGLKARGKRLTGAEYN